MKKDYSSAEKDNRFFFLDYEKLTQTIKNQPINTIDLIKKIGLSHGGFYQTIREKRLKISVLEDICNELNIHPCTFFAPTKVDYELGTLTDQKTTSILRTNDLEPQFLSGDKLTIQELQNWRKIPPFGFPVLVQTIDRREYFRFLVQGDSDENIRLRASDPKVQDLVIPVEGIEKIFSVVSLERAV